MKTTSMTFGRALTSLVLMAAIMFASIVGLGASPQIPLVFGTLCAGLVALSAGYRWDDIIGGITGGIAKSLEAVLILLLIGILVAVWIAAGTVPAMIYYGLMVIDAQYFLASCALVCALVACAIGSWGTVGTVGVAFMGIGCALGLPPAMVAGCIVSGSYLGEVISPLSDATNLASAVVARDVISIVRTVIVPALVAFALCEGAYLVLGNMAHQVGGGLGANVEALTAGLDESFAISPVALVPMLAVVGCILAKIPAIPSMLVGIIAGGFVAVGLQSVSLGELLAAGQAGYVSETGQETLDALLSAGGLESMLYAISVIIVAMGFGGLMQATGQMDAFIGPLVARIRKLFGMSVLTEVTCVSMNVVLPDQYLGIAVPGQMMLQEYDRRGLPRTNLAATLLGSGAVTSPLVPWNTCGIYCAGLLGVGALEYAPFALLGFILPVVMALHAALPAALRRPRRCAKKREREAALDGRHSSSKQAS